MPSKFGGVPVSQDAPKSKFGGVPLTSSAQSLAEQQVAAGLLGGTGQPMSREAARDIAMERMVARSALEGNPNIQMITAPDTFLTRNLGGIIPGIPIPGQRTVGDVSQISGLGVPLSKARAISSGSSFGATDALERVLQDAMVKTGLTTPEAVQALGVQAQRAQSPEDELALNILGGVLPGSATVNSAIRAGANPTALSRVLSGSGAGFKGGLITGINEAITQQGIEDPLTTLATIPETSALPVAGGVLLGGGIPAVGGLISGTGRMLGAAGRSIPRVAAPRLEDVATDIVKPPKAARDSLIRDLETGSFQDSLRTIDAQGRPTSLVDTLEKGIPALDGLSTRIEGFIGDNSDLVLTNNDIADDVLNLADSKRFSSDSVKSGLSNLATKLKGDRTLRQAFDDLKELNERRRSYYKKSNLGQATDQDDLLNEAEQLARDRLSQKLDNVYRGVSGDTDNPYQQYGALKGLLGDLAERGDELITDQRIKRSKGPTLEREVLATIKSNAGLLTGGELGRIDRRVQDMFGLLDQPQPSRIRPLTAPEATRASSQIESIQRQNVLRQAASPEQMVQELERVIAGDRLPNLGQGSINFNDQDVIRELIQRAELQRAQQQLIDQQILQSDQYRQQLQQLMGR